MVCQNMDFVSRMKAIALYNKPAFNELADKYYHIITIFDVLT